VILFAQAKREQGKPLFTLVEKGIFSGVVAGAGLAAYGLYSGLLSL
jgi:arginine:ornithine antiporter/lysine permease